METVSTSELRSKTSSLVRALERAGSVELIPRGQKFAQIFSVWQTDGISAGNPLL